MKLLRYVYNNNPFYLISALLVLFGLRSVFPPGESPSYEWLVMGLLVSYISLLAMTATIIIRAGSVWEDTRTILLVIVFLTAALSVNFDERVIEHPGAGSALLMGGLFFSLLVSKAIFWGLRINIPALFRLPYYLLLCGFFLYPLFLSAMLRLGGSMASDWGVLGFSPFIGFCLLTLIPAIRRGPDYVKDSGTPWRWPLFPWLLFAILALCACCRSYYLSLSFGMGEGSDHAFAPYFLVPILLSICLLVLEVGIAGKHPRVQWIALAVPLLLPLLCVILPAPGDGALSRASSLSPAQGEFLGILVENMASPAFLTLMGLALYYGYACFQGVALAEIALVMTVLAFSVVGRRTVDLATLSSPMLIPVILALAVQLLFAMRKPASWRWFAVAVGGVLALALTFEEGFLIYRGALPIHMLIGTALVLGILFRDPFAKIIQSLGGIFLLLLAPALSYLHGRMDPEISGLAVLVYAAAAPVVQLTYWYLARVRLFYSCGVLTIILCIPAGAWELGKYIWKLQWTSGTWMVLGGVGFFFLAAGISLSKAGILDGLKRRFQRFRKFMRKESVQQQAPDPPDLPDIPGDSILEEP